MRALLILEQDREHSKQAITSSNYLASCIRMTVM